MKKQIGLLMLWAAGLAGLATSCADKNESSPAPAGGSTASYTLDGRTTKAAASTNVQFGTSGGDDRLTIIMVSQPNGKDNEFVEAIFTKPTGTADAEYRALNLRVENESGMSYYADQLTMTLSKSSSGYSGTFAGKRSNSATVSTLSNGLFTNVR
ncbi:hypothetical protein [Hymenobacter metallicola]|uniref:PLAT domain-containing protein n=1 Tax=Hymenobacter metallicola TaxID=2563114 RepID=A0A4Z0QJ11_9BACT|nr:hypothetical protein [Hymenobacter metallicola]TGE28672.1 hypothetical protein E5K02_04175 [Hymenobacter metallicola]